MVTVLDLGHGMLRKQIKEKHCNKFKDLNQKFIFLVRFNFRNNEIQ